MQVRVTPSGILDKDGELSYISNGNYVDANDIRHRQIDGNNFGGVMGVAGNNLEVSIPAYNSSSKKYRVYVDVTDIANGSVAANEGDLFLEDSSGNIFSNLSLNITGTNLTTYITTLKGYLNTLSNSAYGGLFTYSATTTTGTYTAYFDVSTGLDTEWILRVNNTSSTLCSFKLINEYVDASGTFKVIGSYELEDYLFVWLASEEVSTGITSVLSEVGVIYSTDQGATYQYTRLVRSKKLGFSKERRIDAQVERAGNQVNIYWTDGNEKPRAMYLNYPLITTEDGLMYWEGGNYELETIDLESTFFTKAPSAYFTNIQVSDTGGSISSGNKRYTGRFLSEDLVATEFIYPTNPLNIYDASTAEPYKISGDVGGVLTSKSVDLTITNFAAGIYKYFELVAIEYIDFAYTATIVQRYTLGNLDTELQVSHTNIGQDNIPLGTNELVAIFNRYLKAENIRVFDNRVVFSNMTEQIDYDLSAWALNITHSLESRTIPALGKIGTAHDIYDDPAHTNQPYPTKTSLPYNLDEYLDPLNTMNFSSYMFNDTYRFGVQVKWKATGKWSTAYYVDDIRFDSLAYNIDPGDVRRTANNITSNLTDSTNENVYINYVKFGGIDLDYLVDTDNSGLGDTYLRDLIEGFRFVRAERIPEVLATGYFFLGKKFALTATYKRQPFYQKNTGVATSIETFGSVNTTTDQITIPLHGYKTGQPVQFVASGIAPVPLIDTFIYYVIVIDPNTIQLSETPDLVPINFTSSGSGELHQENIPDIHSVGSTNGSEILYFHSVDNYYNGIGYDFDINKNSIKLLGPPENLLTFYFTGADLWDYGTYIDYGGYFSSAKREYLSLDDGTTPYIREHAILQTNQDKNFSTVGLTVNNNHFLENDVFALNTTLRYSGGSYFSAGLANTEDHGLYYGQIFNDLGANKKYPANRENTLYHSIGHFYYLEEGANGTINNIDVFGGDVFTQKTHLPIAINNNAQGQGGVVLGLYSQNSINSQMFNILPDDGTDVGEKYWWPQYLEYKTTYSSFEVISAYSPIVKNYLLQPSPNLWEPLKNFVSQTTYQKSYNKGYDWKDGTILEQGYLKDENYNGNAPTKVVWSARKIVGSRTDSYRLGFGPTEFAELDLTYGPIVHHEVVNNAFYTVQTKSFQRQYFRDASLIGADSGTDVVIGSGSILGSPGVELTSIGADYKWSVVKGQTETGKESLYWYNNKLKKIMRFGQDGVRVISDRGIVSLLHNNTKWMLDEKYPLSGMGIHGVWNDKYSEAIFTMKALNPNIPSWEAIAYSAGDYVYIAPVSTYLHSSNLPYVYKCKANHTASASTKPETGASWQAYWEKITPGTDAEAHTNLTLVYDELKNGFVCTHSYWPDIYLPYQNTFWSPNPLDPDSLYLHDRVGAQIYYDNIYIPTITPVMNYDPNLSKNFEAVQVSCDENPMYTEFVTKNHKSYLDETEFDYREEYFYSPIKNDMLTAPGSSNSEDTTRLWGKWLKIKFSLESASGKQKLMNFIVKFRPMSRLYNQ